MVRPALGIVLLAGTLALSCSGNNATPTSPTGTQPDGTPTSAELTLAPGQRASVAGTALTLHLIGIASDSRCPADAFCVQLGEAIAVFEAALGPQPGTRLELRTSAVARRGQIGTYSIELLTVQPYPFASLPAIDPDAYRATVRVGGSR